MEIQDSVALAYHGDRTRLLEVFRGAIAKPLPASQTAVATMVEAVKPQKQTVLVQDENQLLENGLRTLLEELVSAAVENKKSVMQYGRSSAPDDDGNGLLTRLLDIVLYLCEKGNVEGGMIFQLLEDLTEVSTIKDCKEVFGYIEGKQETLGKLELFNRGKLVMLRTCNQLLRRLSKTNDVVFCGRILMFLAHFFPLSERSAVNIKGVFNTSNETKYEKEAPGDGVAIDFSFYKTFWSLQEYFSTPLGLTHPTKWQTFSANLSTVLEAFEVQPLGEEDESLSLDGDDDDSTFNIKYLTSSNLMSLELKDPGFRRHVLVQCLIVFDFLKTPTGKAEKDGPREVIREELKVHEDRVKKLLRTTPPKAKEFLAAIEHILERDKNWVWWKRDGCTAFEKSVQENKKVAEAPRRKARWRLGNRELSRLWKWSEDNPNAITDAKRAKMPPLVDYFKPLAEDLDPEAGIEEEYHHKNNKVYCWKGLRFAARQDLEALSRYSDMKIMGVVPPDLLTPEVRSSLYKTPDKLRAKGVKKEEEYTPSRAQTEDATGNAATGVNLTDGGDAMTPAQDTEEATPMEAQGPAVAAEVEPEPEGETGPEPVVEPVVEAAKLEPERAQTEDKKVEPSSSPPKSVSETPPKPKPVSEPPPSSTPKAKPVSEPPPSSTPKAKPVSEPPPSSTPKAKPVSELPPSSTPKAKPVSEPPPSSTLKAKPVSEPPPTIPKSELRSGKKRPLPED